MFSKILVAHRGAHANSVDAFAAHCRLRGAATQAGKRAPEAQRV